MPMKTIGVIKILNIVFYLSFTRCSLDYANSVANSTEKEDKLWFSFNKETFDDFRSNLTDKTLNEKCITNVPFGYNTSLGIFLNVFCLFYQNSKLVNDENFLEAFEKYYNSCNEEEEERFKKASFEDFFKQQDIKMNEIIMGRETFNDTIKVDIKNGRVILEMTDKIKNNSPETNTSESSNLQDTIKTSKIGFIIKFDEMFLQGLLGKGYLNSLGDFNNEYVAKGFDPTKTSSDEPLYELFKLCSRIDHFIRVSRGSSLIKTEEESRKECLLEIFESFETYTLSLFKNRKSSGPFEYLEKLMEKVTARAMYHFEENLDIFSSYSQEYTESVNALKSLLKQYFEEMNLSEASIERLVMLCFELNV